MVVQQRLVARRVGELRAREARAQAGRREVVQRVLVDLLRGAMPVSLAFGVILCVCV